MRLTFTTLLANSADVRFMIFFLFCPLRRQESSGDNLHEMSKPILLRKIRKIFQIVICWNLLPIMLTQSIYFVTNLRKTNTLYCDNIILTMIFWWYSVLINVLYIYQKIGSFCICDTNMAFKHITLLRSAKGVQMGHMSDTAFFLRRKTHISRSCGLCSFFARAKNPYHHIRSTRRSFQIRHQIGKLVRKKNVW